VKLWQPQKDISVKLLPAIPLTIGVVDTSQYGYLEDPITHYTGARFNFDLDSRDIPVKFKISGWDIDRTNEIQIFINGAFLGNMSVTPDSSFGSPDTFLIPTSLLSIGKNEVELQQRKRSNTFTDFAALKWAVKDISVDFVRPDLTALSLSIENPVISGKPFNAVAEVKNLGEAPSSPGRINFYLSQDDVISTDDMPIGTSELSPITPSETLKLSKVGLSTQQVNTNYYLGFCISEVANEINLANNCSTGIELKNNSAIAPIIMLLVD